MNTVSLVQPNFQQGPKNLNSYYLPYSVGILWAYAKSDFEIDQNFKLNQIVWRRDDIEQVTKQLSNDKVVALSCYVWNKNYNYALAKKLKEINPGIVIVAGGPELPIEKDYLFEKHPYIDIVVKKEGEIVFRDLLKKLLHNNWSIDSVKSIPGLLLNQNAQILDTGHALRINNLDDIPSPYLTGVFDELVEQNPDVEWNSTLETNRGCPFACTFCDWGSLTYNKVKKFDLDRIFLEMEWMAKNKCGFLAVTDANFGIFLERDNLIADKILELQEKYGYPYVFSVSWAKNQKDGVIDIVKKLVSNSSFNQGLTVSVQSMNLDVLENIKRKNLDQHKINDILDLCNKNNIPSYTELILGLPGETLESWKNNFWQLFEAGAHAGLNIFQAQLLENAEMNTSQREEYNIQSIAVYDYISGSYTNEEHKEEINVVTSTKDLPFNDMLEAHVFNWLVQTFHINGITTYISRILNKVYGIEYKEFYTLLQDCIEQDSWLKNQKDEIYNSYRKWSESGISNTEVVGGIEIPGWNLLNTTTLKIVDQNKYNHIYNFIEKFVLENFDVDENFVKQLLLFNRLYAVDYHDIKNYPTVQNFDYDFLGHLLDDLELNRKVCYEFTFVDDNNMSKETFLEYVYLARRRNFGKAIISEVDTVDKQDYTVDVDGNVEINQ